MRLEYLENLDVRKLEIVQEKVDVLINVREYAFYVFFIFQKNGFLRFFWKWCIKKSLA